MLIINIIHVSVTGQEISIKGMIVDSTTPEKKISNAVVRLIGVGLTDTADIDGMFAFSKNTWVDKSFNANSLSIEYLQIKPSGVFISVKKSQNVAISIHNAAGKKIIIRSGYMLKGIHYIGIPKLSGGLYIVSVSMDQGMITGRFIHSGKGFTSIPDVADKGNNASTALYKRLFTDTLLVKAKGYTSVKKAIFSASDSNVVIKLSPYAGDSPCGQKPCDPNADSNVRNLLCYLKTQKFISGQTGTRDCDSVMAWTGRYPAICAFDDPNNAPKAIEWANKKKGVIAWQWHWSCPHGGNYAADCDFAKDIEDSSSELWSDVDFILSKMKQIGDAGFPVLFRPLHECNDNYMWWAKKTASNYKKLWILFYKRAQVLNVHNLVWNFNGMPDTKGYRTPMKDFYPGDQYVDIVSSDYCVTASDLTVCKSIGTNKTVGISETFNQLNPAKAAPWPFSVVWASRDWNSTSKSDWIAAMKDPRTISVDQIPDITLW
jgi:hypothetical protein